MEQFYLDNDDSESSSIMEHESEDNTLIDDNSEEVVESRLVDIGVDRQRTNSEISEDNSVVEESNSSQGSHEDSFVTASSGGAPIDPEQLHGPTTNSWSELQIAFRRLIANTRTNVRTIVHQEDDFEDAQAPEIPCQSVLSQWGAVQTALNAECSTTSYEVATRFPLKFSYYLSSQLPISDIEKLQLLSCPSAEVRLR